MNKTEIREKVEKAIDTVRPYLHADGGDISVEEITDDLIVKVKLLGACNGCPFSVQTLSAGVENAIRKELPDLKEVVAVEA
jgi:Fe-S cluster biogenesis protein NfuA